MDVAAAAPWRCPPAASARTRRPSTVRLANALSLVIFHALGPLAHGQSASTVCPRLMVNSIPLCGRCVHDELCQIGYVCDPVRQFCVNETWSPATMDAVCVQFENDPSSWGARCEVGCTDQAAPYACAENCLNEEFPCRWTNGCYGSELVDMDLKAGVCMRPCQDHVDWLPTVYGLSTCADVILAFGCGATAGVSKYCPVSCGSNECSQRCSDPAFGDEPGVDGKRCFTRVFDDGLSCYEALLEGRDCHCTCADHYTAIVPSTIGAFGKDSYYDGQSVAQTIVAEAGIAFTVSVTGMSMSIDGSMRIAFIDGAGGVCASSQTTSCGTDNGLWNCATVPTATTYWVHRWENVVIAQCASLKLCHCNLNCQYSYNWREVGTVEVEPYQHPEGMVGRPLEGCEAYLGMPTGIAYVIDEQYIDKKIISTIDISGGLLWNQETQGAIQRAMQRYLRVHSQLLGHEVPDLSDIEIVPDSRRRLEAWWRPWRQLQEIQERIDPFALRVHVKVRTYTTGTADLFTERLLALSTDSVAFLTYLHTELAESGLAESMLPDFLSLFLSGEPYEVIVYNDEPPEEGSITMFIVLINIGIVLAGCFCICMCRCLYIKRLEPKVEPEELVDETAEGSWRKKRPPETYTVPEVDEEEEEGGKKPGFFGRMFGRGKQSDDPAEAWPAPKEEPRIQVGMVVTLENMAKRRWNGQLATVKSGPNRKGEWLVEIAREQEDKTVVHDTMHVKEVCLEPLQYRFQEKSYRSRN